jgi:hypothetical protein
MIGFKNMNRLITSRVYLLLLTLPMLLSVNCIDSAQLYSVRNETPYRITETSNVVSTDTVLPFTPWVSLDRAVEVTCGPINPGETRQCDILDGTIIESEKPGNTIMVTIFDHDDLPTILYQRLIDWTELKQDGIVISETFP